MNNEQFDFYSPINIKSYNLNDSIKYYLSMMENVDYFTRKHSENVGNLVCRICEYMKFKKYFIVYATTCAYIHDIGKLFIPKEILKKMDYLNEEDFEIFKTHTTLGYDTCIKDPKLRQYADAILSHHENLDGTGYPAGLVKKDIPLVSQIIRVADEYDLLVSKRKYSTHLNITATLQDMLEDTKPFEETTKFKALNVLVKDSKVGKINAKILKALFKVVIDDTLYEITGLLEYQKALKIKLRRLNTIDSYYKKMVTAKNPKQQNYYREGMLLLLHKNETLDNIMDVYRDYKEAYNDVEDKIRRLYEEIRIIKSLK